MNNCVAFTGEYADADRCPTCSQQRYYQTTNRPRKCFIYIPIIDRLKLQYQNPARARILSTYRQNLTQESRNGELRDFFDGELYRQFHIEKLKLFQDHRDVAFHLSLDGVQLTNMRHHEVTPVILINLNLPPEERYQIKNILASMILPGPKKPKNLDSFLRPLVDELKQLDKGVTMIDGNTATPFVLRAWATMVTGDGPALAEAIGFKRPGNAIRPCRTCTIKAQQELNPGRKRTYYLPHTDYSFNSPPYRGNNTDIRRIIKLIAESGDPEYEKRFGIVRPSILLELRSLHFTLSFPVDIMHCILQNITEMLFKLWNRTKLQFEQNLKDSELTNRHLQSIDLNTISSAIADSRRDMPAYLCRTPRRIDNHYKGYKAAEWEAWLQYFGVPLLDQHLGDEYVMNFGLLSRIYSLATRYSFSESKLPEFEALVIKFVKDYERLYYQNEPRRLSVCTVNVHYLLHLPLYIQQCGPARYWWQFPMERYCGEIKPMATSKSRLSESVANTVVIIEHLHHLQFTRIIQPEASQRYPQLLSIYKPEISRYQLQRLAELLGYDIFTVKSYRRCLLRQGLVIGSLESQRRCDTNRRNDQICYQISRDYEPMFGVVHQFAEVVGPRPCYLAWIRQYSGVQFDSAKRIINFSSYGGYFWIDVTYIKSLIGTIQEGNVAFIVTDISLFDD